MVEMNPDQIYRSFAVVHQKGMTVYGLYTDGNEVKERSCIGRWYCTWQNEVDPRLFECLIELKRMNAEAVEERQFGKTAKVEQGYTSIQAAPYGKTKELLSQLQHEALSKEGSKMTEMEAHYNIWKLQNINLLEGDDEAKESEFLKRFYLEGNVIKERSWFDQLLYKPTQSDKNKLKEAIINTYKTIDPDCTMSIEGPKVTRDRWGQERSAQTEISFKALLVASNLYAQHQVTATSWSPEEDDESRMY